MIKAQEDIDIGYVAGEPGVVNTNNQSKIRGMQSYDNRNERVLGQTYRRNLYPKVVYLQDKEAVCLMKSSVWNA